MSNLTQQTSSNQEVFIGMLGKVNGGAERDRTDDLLLARQALSQLSYSPKERYGGPRLT